MSRLFDALLAEHGPADREREPEISVEGQIARLCEHLGYYQTDNPFKVGDLVHPRADSNIKGRGRPHIVLETCSPFHAFAGDSSSVAYGQRIDMRVGCLHQGQLVKWWVESAEFEPFIAS